MTTRKRKRLLGVLFVLLIVTLIACGQRGAGDARWDQSTWDSTSWQ